jgi:hypothetical protein
MGFDFTYFVIYMIVDVLPTMYNMAGFLNLPLIFFVQAICRPYIAKSSVIGYDGKDVHLGS